MSSSYSLTSEARCFSFAACSISWARTRAFRSRSRASALEETLVEATVAPETRARCEACPILPCTRVVRAGPSVDSAYDPCERTTFVLPVLTCSRALCMAFFVFWRIRSASAWEISMRPDIAGFTGNVGVRPEASSSSCHTAPWLNCTRIVMYSMASNESRIAITMR